MANSTSATLSPHNRRLHPPSRRFILISVPSRPSSRNPPAVHGELALIERIRSRARAGASRPSSLRLGIGDDCAILAPKPGHDLLVTTDFSLEGRHFRRSSGGAWHSPQSIGHRTLARGLSDLAAMGATPMAAFLSLALPKSIARDSVWLDGFLDGLLTLAKLHHVPLAGGDTSESPTDPDTPNNALILADIVLLGSAPTGRALRRSTAKPGDRLYVTGSLGGSATELQTISRPSQSPSSRPKRSAAERPLYSAGSSDHPHLFPQPRLAVGQALLRRHLATACIYLSDGLSTDLNHLCTASHVAAELDIAALPLHPLTSTLDELAQITAAIHGGEDYELLFTAAPSTKIPRSIAGVPITPIGRILKPHKNRPVMTIVSDENRFQLQPHGWEHLT
jgi:thiamine-monophosphate kinase